MGLKKKFRLPSQKYPIYTYKGKKFSEDYWGRDDSIYAGDVPRLIEELENEGKIEIQTITLYKIKGSDNWTENPKETLEDYAEELEIERTE